jgi:hypothetical protein
VYQRRKEDADFARRWEEALEAGVEKLEETAWNRAVEGSDTLMIFLLKAHRPDKYLERRDFTSKGEKIASHPITIVEVHLAGEHNDNEDASIISGSHWSNGQAKLP